MTIARSLLGISFRFGFFGLLILSGASAVAGQSTLPDIGDSYVRSDEPTLVKGTEHLLYLFNIPFRTGIVYLQFDTSQLLPLSKPNQVVNATLKLTDAGSVSAVFDVAHVEGSWTESTLTWNNKPAAGPVITTFSFQFPKGAYPQYQIDVTAGVQAWQNGTHPNLGLVLLPHAGTKAVFYSKEQSQISFRPLIAVIYAKDVPPHPLPPNLNLKPNVRTKPQKVPQGDPAPKVQPPRGPGN